VTLTAVVRDWTVITFIRLIGVLAFIYLVLLETVSDISRFACKTVVTDLVFHLLFQQFCVQLLIIHSDIVLT